jgi:hypothetical protein
MTIYLVCDSEGNPFSTSTLNAYNMAYAFKDKKKAEDSCGNNQQVILFKSNG